LILVSFDLFTQGWALPDTLANLEADSRTTAIPYSSTAARVVDQTAQPAA